MAARVVALIPPSAELNSADPARPEYVEAWVNNICAEDTEEERAQWYGIVYGAGYRSKRRLRNMDSATELLAHGIPMVVARIMVQQAQRLHGVQLTDSTARGLSAR